jgi:hypothetical protein
MTYSKSQRKHLENMYTPHWSTFFFLIQVMDNNQIKIVYNRWEIIFNRTTVAETDVGSFRLIAPDVHGQCPKQKARLLFQFHIAKNKTFCHVYFPTGRKHGCQICVNENTHRETCFCKIHATITIFYSANTQVAKALLQLVVPVW